MFDDQMDAAISGAPFDAVIVPLDGSSAGEVVVPLAKAMAAATAAPIVFIRVVPYPEPPAAAPSHGPAPESNAPWPVDVVAAERDARAYLEEARGRLGAPDAATVVAVGDPFNRIRSEVVRRRRPLIVLTAKATAALPMSRDSQLARRLAFAGVGPVVVVPPADAPPQAQRGA